MSKRRIAVLMIMTFVCCGCRFCGTDWDRSQYDGEMLLWIQDSGKGPREGNTPSAAEAERKQVT